MVERGGKPEMLSVNGARKVTYRKPGSEPPRADEQEHSLSSSATLIVWSRDFVTCPAGVRSASAASH